MKYKIMALRTWHFIASIRTVRRHVVGIAIISSIIGSIFVDAYIQNHKPIEYTAVAHAEERRVVLIEPEITWNEGRITEEIRKVFPEAPETMVRVAKCESGLLPSAFNAKTKDSGVFQINEASHAKAMKEMGIDPYDVKENLQFARYLYDHGGLAHWRASKHCWNK